MADDIIRYMSVEDMAAARIRYLQVALAPIVKTHVLDVAPEVASATLCISQFFNDEARDEVHGRWELSESPGVYSFSGWVNGQRSQGREFSYNSEFRQVWSGQLWCISMFSAYSPEVVFDPSEPDSWGACASFERTDTGVNVEVSSTIPRPWLSGVAPNYLRGDNPAGLRAELLEWLDWLDPTIDPWAPELASARDKALDAILILRDSLLDENADLVRRIDSEVDEFLERGPQPYASLSMPSGDFEWRGLKTKQSRDCLAAAKDAYQAATKLLPPPRAAYRS